MLFGLFKKKNSPGEPPKQFPPVPDWRPTIRQPSDQIVERVRFYSNFRSDIALFQYGTCVLLPDSMSDDDATAYAKDTLAKIINYHPDMKPAPMKDGNILIQYNHPALNVVLADVAAQHWREIDDNHQRALATSEVLLTPLGQNVFDDFGKKALFGRCFMFMDAQSPNVIGIFRKSA